VRFEVDYVGAQAPAFVVRFRGRVVAYLNRCGHMPMELDWREGVFFDSEGRDLLCSTHGAAYDAASGSWPAAAAVAGPAGACRWYACALKRTAVTFITWD
jgi:nitrite reductase/ring-hydroxylating ferredoxin subunit